MLKTRIAMLGLLSAASLLTLTAAQAQNAAPSVATGPRPQMQQRIEQMRAHHQERQADRAQALHDILAITPAQEGAWAAFQAATKPPARPEGPGMGPGQGRPGREEMEKLTTPQRLDKQLENANRRHAALQARINATRQFYAQLSPAQKKAFDALPMMGGGRGGPGGPGGRMGPGGPGGDRQMGQGGRGFGEQRGGRRGQGGPRGGPEGMMPAPQ